MAWQFIENDCFEEKMMWVGVLRRAIFDYVLYKGKAKFEIKWKRAYQFLFGEVEVPDGQLDFEEVCGLFGWDPDYIRRLVLKLDRTDIHRLEATRFKDDFKQDTCPPTRPEPTRLESSCTCVPMFLHLMYSRDYRKGLKPETIYQETFFPHVSTTFVRVQAA